MHFSRPDLISHAIEIDAREHQMSNRTKLQRPTDEAVIDRERGAFAGDVAQRILKSLKGSTGQTRGPPVDADAFSIGDFCKRHGISRQHFYKFKKEMPQTFQVGTRVLISKEAAAKWRAKMEAEALAKRDREKAASAAEATA
jgi:hypothetical protein